MEWMKWVRMVVRVRWETRKARGGAGVAGISRASMTRYERGDCPLQERLEEWARGLGMDVAQAVAAWHRRYLRVIGKLPELLAQSLKSVA